MKHYYQWHRALAWVVGIVALLWSLSGFLHPVMSFLSIRPAVFNPPAYVVSLPKAVSFETWFQADKVRSARLLEYKKNTIAQIIDDQGHVQYRNPQGEIVITDQEYAQYLAQFYTQQQSPITSAEYITDFSLAYPAVNRLLPVWQVKFDTPNELVAYIHTPSDQLAALSNHTRNQLLWWFQNIHTLHALAQYPNLRVSVITLLMVLMGVMVYLGLRLLLVRKAVRKKISLRFVHHALGWVCVLPLIAFLVSGLFHLWVKPINSDPLNVRTVEVSKIKSLFISESEAYSYVRLWVQDEHHVVWRLVKHTKILAQEKKYAVQQVTPHSKNTHSQAHDHQATKAILEPVEYVDALTGQMLNTTDAQMATAWLKQQGFSVDKSADKVSNFTPEYAFANRWLPVWRVVGRSGQEKYFVSTQAGLLSAAVEPWQIMEQWSFNSLHKWHFLNGIGRVPRDILLSLMAVLIALSTLLGVVMLIKNYSRRV